MSRGRKSLIYKNEKYDYETLITLHFDENVKKYFSEGDVTDNETGELIPICNLFETYMAKNKEVAENLSHLSYSNRAKFAKIISNKMLIMRDNELRSKLETDTITLEECEELLMLEKKIIINSDGDKELNIQPKYSNFVILNRGIPKPKTLSHDYYGKFFDLLQLMTIKNNNLKHNNQHPYKKKDICEHLGVKTERALEIFFKALREHNMIAVTNSSEHKFITLNPAYVNMSIRLTEDTYRFFKSDLDKILTPLEIKYFQLLNLDSPVIVMEE